MKMPKLKTITHKGLPAVGGGIAAGFVSNLAKKVITNAGAQKFLPAAPFLVGLFLSEQKGMLEYAGIGMMAVGGQKIAGALVPSLAGIEDMDLSGIFDDSVSDDLSDSDINGPLNSPLEGASDDYSEDY